MLSGKDLKGTVLRIERISLNDGIGMRTVVFFKGCPCRCAWCSTPEAQNPKPEVYYMKGRCRLCMACIPACPYGALRYDEEAGMILRDHDKCTNCFKCVDVCNYRAHRIYGEEMSVSQVMKEIHKDEIFYFYSEGGVTLSGGDIFVQPEFAEAILLECEDQFIDTCAELDMYTTRENVAKIIPHLNMFYVDVKVMDREKHMEWTGVDNTRILENIRYASEICKKNAIHIRVPMVEGVNDSEENIKATALFCSELKNCVELEFLPYHRLGVHAYEQMQREYVLADRKPMTRFDVYEKIKFLCDMELPYTIKISNFEIYNVKDGVLSVTEEELKQ